MVDEIVADLRISLGGICGFRCTSEEFLVVRKKPKVIS